ncbi:MAG: flagellar basal body-associated protein FliL [Burkholderiales bacterium]
MATAAPKAAPKASPKPVVSPDAMADALVAEKSKNRMIMIVVISAALLIAGGGSAAAWYFMQGNASSGAPAAKKTDTSKAPVFVLMEPFTVNLQSENGDQFLQVTLTLQVPDQAQEDLIKTFMPQVRSRLLFLLSSKKPSEISSVEGKKKLIDEIINTVNQPFTSRGPAQDVSNVFFTSFVIQ